MLSSAHCIPSLSCVRSTLADVELVLDAGGLIHAALLEGAAALRLPTEDTIDNHGYPLHASFGLFLGLETPSHFLRPRLYFTLCTLHFT